MRGKIKKETVLTAISLLAVFITTLYLLQKQTGIDKQEIQPAAKQTANNSITKSITAADKNSFISQNQLKGKKPGKTNRIMEKIEEYAKTFNLPRELKEELFALSEKDSPPDSNENTAADEPLNEDVLARFIQNKETNINSAGYRISAEQFNQLIEVCLPRNTEQAVIDTDKELKSQALLTVGLSALTDFNYTRAQKAFETVIGYYPDSLAGEAAALELGHLLFDRGNADQGRQVIDDAIYLHRDDKEYIGIAESLKEELSK